METVDFSRIPIKKGQTLLDLGCGEGRHSLAASYHMFDAQVFGVDLNENDLPRAKNKSEDFLGQHASIIFVKANGLALPFDDASIDHVICSEVLEHIPDDAAFLKEIHRVLKPQGSLTISVPRAWPEKICWSLSTAYHQVEGGHVRIYNKKKLNHAVTRLGYTLQSSHYAHALHTPYWWLKCLFWRKEKDVWLTRWYHKLLVWDLLKKPKLTQTLERWLNPIMGKSVAFYYKKNNL